MTTSALDRVPVDAITAQAREVHPGRAVLTVIAGVLFGVGWVTARVFSALWLAFTWSWVAVREGWESAHGPSRGKRIAMLEAQNAELKTQLGRFSG